MIRIVSPSWKRSDFRLGMAKEKEGPSKETDDREDVFLQMRRATIVERERLHS